MGATRTLTTTEPCQIRVLTERALSTATAFSEPKNLVIHDDDAGWAIKPESEEDEADAEMYGELGKVMAMKADPLAKKADLDEAPTVVEETEKVATNSTSLRLC